MEDKFEDLINILGKNKKILLLAIVIYILATIGIIVYIWWPKEKTYTTFESINITSKQQQMLQEYVNEISFLFKSEDKAGVKKIISSEYVNYTGNAREEIIEQLEKEGYFNLYSEVKGTDLYIDGDTYVYSMTVYYGDNSRKMNIIETYPYEYTITFDDFYKYSNSKKQTRLNNVVFTINEIYRNMKYIKIDLSIENKNNTYARFNFNNIAAVQAVLTDGTAYSMTNLVSTEEYTNIDSNTTITKSLIFEIPAQLQNGIEYIVFNGVSINLATLDMKIAI